MTLSDGTLLQGDGKQNEGSSDLGGTPLYVVQDGRRHRITDVQAFLDAGYDPDDVQVVDQDDLEQMPLAEDPEEKMVAGQTIVLSHYSFLGAGHYMRTYGALRKTSPGARIDATTRTWTITMFGGFRGGVQIIFSDAEGFPIGASPVQRFGVDGTWIGRSDRTDYWSATLNEDWATRVTDISIFHFWDPNRLETQVAKLVAVVKPLTEIIKELVAIGVSVATTKK